MGQSVALDEYHRLVGWLGGWLLGYTCTGWTCGGQVVWVLFGDAFKRLALL